MAVIVWHSGVLACGGSVTEGLLEGFEEEVEAEGGEDGAEGAALCKSFFLYEVVDVALVVEEVALVGAPVEEVEEGEEGLEGWVVC